MSRGRHKQRRRIEAEDGEIIGKRFGAWRVAAVDGSRKRATAVCWCGRVSEVALASLEDGSSRGCGCIGAPKKLSAANSRGSFASALAAAERRSQAQWRHGGGRG